MLTFWKKNSKILIDSNNNIIKCNTCPCKSVEPPEPGELEVILVYLNKPVDENSIYDESVEDYIGGDYKANYYPEIDLIPLLLDNEKLHSSFTGNVNGTFSILGITPDANNIYTLINKSERYYSTCVEFYGTPEEYAEQYAYLENNNIPHQIPYTPEEYEDFYERCTVAYTYNLKFDSNNRKFLFYSSTPTLLPGNTLNYVMQYTTSTKTLQFQIKIQIDNFYHACLTPDTLITMADGSEKAIKDILKNEYIRSIDQKTGLYIKDKVLYNRYNNHFIKKSYDKWVFLNGVILKTIGPHRMYNVDREAYIYMNLWNIGLSVQFADGSVSKLVLHLVINELTICCSLITKNLTYIANGMLTGTKNANSKTPFNIADFL